MIYLLSKLGRHQNKRCLPEEIVCKNNHIFNDEKQEEKIASL
jgi:hypothetical protein